jgi:hypothetical protein
MNPFDWMKDHRFQIVIITAAASILGLAISVLILVTRIQKDKKQPSFITGESLPKVRPPSPQTSQKPSLSRNWLKNDGMGLFNTVFQDPSTYLLLYGF